MKKKYILALFLSFGIIVGSYFVGVNKNSFAVSVKEVNLESNCKVTTINKDEEKYSIKAYKPTTQIQELNKKIDEEYTRIIDKFTKEVNALELLGDGKKFTLTINFNDYEYNDYYSFLISYSYDLGGAHPDSSIKTINYNIKEKSFVTIDTLISCNKNIIDVFSKYSYENLSKKTELTKNKDILKNETLANKDNFESFVFSKEGLILFFPNYSVASYYLGDFEVVIPYNKLGI